MLLLSQGKSLQAVASTEHPIAFVFQEYPHHLDDELLVIGDQNRRGHPCPRSRLRVTPGVLYPQITLAQRKGYSTDAGNRRAQAFTTTACPVAGLWVAG